MLHVRRYFLREVKPSVRSRRPRRTGLGARWPESTLLDAGATIGFLFANAAPVLAALVLLVGLAGVGASAGAILGRGYRPAMATAALGSVTVVTLPLRAIGGFLCRASGGHVDFQLHHSTLPQLAAAGAVEFDANSETVRYRGHPGLEALLDGISGC